MEFGVMQVFQQPPGKTTAQVVQETLEMAQYAEELGLDTIWLAEHHFSPYGTIGSPLMVAAAIAQRTKKIKIGIAVLILPFYDPVRLAEECALVDILSGGRLKIGYGRGYQPLEFKGMRVNQSEARKRTEEIVEIMKLAWTEDSFSYDGQFYKIENLSVYPRPVQTPYPPLLQAASSLDSFQIAGSRGIPILTSPNFTPLNVVKQQSEMYFNSLEEAGYKGNGFLFPIMQQMYIGNDPDDSYRTPEPHAMWYQRLLGSLIPGGKEAAPEGYENWNKIGKNINQVTYDQIFNDGAIYATAEDAIKKLEYLRVEVGVNNYIAWLNFGTMPHKLAMRSMERLAKQVMPFFR